MPDSAASLELMPLLGAHVDSSGGLHLAFERAAAMGAEAIQVHPTPPGFWGSPKLDERRISTFKEAAAKHGNPPFYFHAVYLINLAGDDPSMRQRSESTLAGYLKAADELGINGVIFHTGSHKGAGFEARLPNIIEHLKKVLERADPKQARLHHREQRRARRMRRCTVRRDRPDARGARRPARVGVLRHLPRLRLRLRRADGRRRVEHAGRARPRRRPQAR